MAFSLTALARCAAERGEFAEAVAAGARAVELADAVDQPFTTVATSRAAGSGAVDVAEHHRHLGLLAWAHWLLSEVSLAEGARVDVVESHLDRALALTEPRRMRPLMAHCRLTRGKLEAACGKRQAAADEIDAALAAYRAMEMEYWRALAETQRAALA